MPDPQPADPARWYFWRSPRLAWGVCAVGLLVGLPPFVRMPPWCDITLYDVAARNILQGGTHYKDVFDTNLPGFVWTLAGIRAVFGWDSETLRVFDLLIVGGALALAGRVARRGGATAASLGWAAAGAAWFYPFLSEFNHCQRDVWMMLPALGATALRLGRADRPGERPFSRSVLEGLCWGLAVWVKPHVVFMAAAVWLVSAWRLTKDAPQPWRAAVADFAGNVVGGLLVGLPGIGYLMASGTWGPFVDVFTNWNTGYLSLILSELSGRMSVQLTYFPPWSLLQLVVVPLAVLNVLDARPWLRRDDSTEGPASRLLPGGWVFTSAPTDARFARAALSALYLAWFSQALFLQKQYHYVHVPEVFLGLAVLATHRWAGSLLPLGWLLAASLYWSAGRWCDGWHPPRRYGPGYENMIDPHPASDPARMGWWPGCWRKAPDWGWYYARRDGVGMDTDFEAGIDWEQLYQVEVFLRGEKVGDRELICWSDSPHPLYLMLGVKPGIRFMHLTTAVSMGDHARTELERETREAVAGGARFAVSDMTRVFIGFPDQIKARVGEEGPDLLPPALPGFNRESFPLMYPGVFRSRDRHGRPGRYVVHRLQPPQREPDGKVLVGDVDVRGWPWPGKLGPE